MARYLEILANQSPFQYGEDVNRRVLFSCNFSTVVASLAPNFELDMATILASTVTLGTNLFIGEQAVIPDGDGPFVSLIVTGGVHPLETHNNDKYPRPSFQLITRGTDYIATRNLAAACFAALDGIHDLTIPEPE